MLKNVLVEGRERAEGVVINQTLANRGPDSRFVLEVIFNPQIPKSS